MTLLRHNAPRPGLSIIATPTKYLLLTLGERMCRVFYYNESQLTNIRSIEADIDPASNSTDHDALLYIFMHKVEDELTILLKNYPFPVYVAGKVPLLRNFRKVHPISPSPLPPASYAH